MVVSKRKKGRKPGRKPLSRLNCYRMGPFLVVEDDAIWLQAEADKRGVPVAHVFREWVGAARKADEQGLSLVDVVTERLGGAVRGKEADRKAG